MHKVLLMAILMGCSVGDQSTGPDPTADVVWRGETFARCGWTLADQYHEVIAPPGVEGIIATTHYTMGWLDACFDLCPNALNWHEGSHGDVCLVGEWKVEQ